jgi:hypothetical protein
VDAYDLVLTWMPGFMSADEKGVEGCVMTGAHRWVIVSQSDRQLCRKVLADVSNTQSCFIIINHLLVVCTLIILIYSRLPEIMDINSKIQHILAEYNHSQYAMLFITN